jgi:Zn-dependent protease
MDGFDISKFIMTITALILGITVHEAAHAIVADRLGDNTPRSQGRVTLWPLAHLDPIGTLFMVMTVLTGFGIGWGKPVMTDPRQYKINWRVADSLVAVAGPISNLILAVLFSLVVRFQLFPPDDPFHMWAVIIVVVNTALFLFNLLPFYPLDGSHLLANALPAQMGEAYRRTMMQYGLIIFVGLLLLRIPSMLLAPAVMTMVQFLIR